MNEETVWNELAEIFREVFDDDEIVIGPDSKEEELAEWDSMSNIQLLVAIDKAFYGVNVNTGEVANLKNVGEMVAVIMQRVIG